MSFFNMLQQYVSSGVANLNISPRRFTSSSRENSATSSEEAAAPPPLKPAPPPASRTPTMQRSSPAHQHQHHLFLQDRSKSLKTVPSLQHQGRLNPRSGSLKEVPSLSISPPIGQSSGIGGSGGGGGSSAAVAPSSPQILQHHASSGSKKREPIKVLPTFALRGIGDGGPPRRTSWPQFAITGSG